jgi:hypothetical protein
MMRIVDPNFGLVDIRDPQLEFITKAFGLGGNSSGVAGGRSGSPYRGDGARGDKAPAPVEDIYEGMRREVHLDQEDEERRKMASYFSHPNVLSNSIYNHGYNRYEDVASPGLNMNVTSSLNKSAFRCNSMTLIDTTAIQPVKSCIYYVFLWASTVSFDVMYSCLPCRGKMTMNVRLGLIVIFAAAIYCISS